MAVGFERYVSIERWRMFSGRSSGRIAVPAALTGELTLNGRILTVSGVREKLLAAHRAGVKLVIFPEKNAPDLRDIPDDIQRDMEIIAISELREIVDRVIPVKDIQGDLL